MNILRLKKSTSWGWHLILCGIGFPYPRVPTKSSKVWCRRFDGLHPDEVRLIIESQYEEFFGVKPNLDNPKTMSEKLCWIKLYYHDPLMTKCADKVCARHYFLEKFPDREDLLVRQLSVCDKWEDLEFEKFPDEFVLKSNWGSGAQIIVRDKKSFNPSSVAGKVRRWIDQRSNHYYNFFEWGYKNIIPKIVVEEFLNFKYKIEFFCFNGKPKFFWVVFNDKSLNTKANLYWLDGSKIPVISHYPNFDELFTKPKCYDEMLLVAEKLAGEFPFVRCDFYVTEKGYKFSELTFFHWAGYCDFSPTTWDLRFGDFIELPKKNM